MATPKTNYDPAESPGGVSDMGRPPAPAGFWPTLKRLYLGVPGIIAGVVLGIVIGYAVNTTDPSAELTSWLGILGKLFINAVKCLVGPLVFCSLVVGMADMLAVGKAGAIGSRALLMYCMTTIIAACEGLIWVVIFRPLFSNRAQAIKDESPKFALECDEPGYFLTNVNGTVECTYDEAFNSTGTHSGDAVFYATDINGVFQPAASSYSKLSLSDTLQSQLNTLVPSNITTAFANADLLSIIMFAIMFGVAIASLPRDMKLVGDFFREINQVFMTMIQWVIACTPIALVSLLTGVVAEQTDLGDIINDVGFFVLCSILGMLVHLWGIFPLLLRIFVKGNPFAYLKHIVPAQVFALSCASSMATLPITMRCVDATQKVSRTLSRFCLSLGATINMDGAAICYPIAVVFMAEAEGLGHIIGGAQYFLIILVSTLGAIGAGPVPAASIVITMTVWTSVFPNVELPSSFAYIIATDWLLDRFSTATNVTGDTVISRIVAEWTDEAQLEEDDEELEALSNRVSARFSGAVAYVEERKPSAANNV